MTHKKRELAAQLLASHGLNFPMADQPAGAHHGRFRLS